MFYIFHNDFFYTTTNTNNYAIKYIMYNVTIAIYLFLEFTSKHCYSTLSNIGTVFYEIILSKLKMSIKLIVNDG